MKFNKEVGSSDIPWRTLVKLGWSSDHIKRVKESANTPADSRTYGQRILIDHALNATSDVGGNRRRHAENVAIAQNGTRVRTIHGLKTVRRHKS